MKFKRYTVCIFLLITTLIGCMEDDDKLRVAPANSDAEFTYFSDSDNPNLLTFKGSPSAETWYSHWNFGDNTSAEGLEVQKTFYLKGEYDVKFKIFTEGGTAESTQKIVIENDFTGSNLVSNGKLDNDSSWNLLSISPGVDITFQDGKATWSGGGWGQAGIYQQFDVEVNKTYQIQMDVAGSGMSDCWFEVYIGSTTPTDGVDYTDGGIRLGLNTWDGCGIEPFDGPLTSLSCSVGGGDGSFEFNENKSVYIVIRSGGANLGTSGVSVDNVAVRAL